VKRRPRVLVAALGGTISTVPDAQGRNVPARTVTEIMDAVPGVEEVAEVVAVDVGRISSRAVGPADMHRLAHEIESRARGSCDGVVVTHGTDTMEETAYALALMLDLNVPVVLTGAMRLPHAAGADGPANLLTALQTSVTSEVASLGPVVVMHDEIHLARVVVKSHTSRVAAFSSPGLGPAGYVSEGRVYLNSLPTQSDYLGLPGELDVRVELIWVAAGADGLLVDAAASAAQGLVIAGTGGGHVPPLMADSLRTAVERGLPVVLASRTGSGPLLENTYGGAGSETHLREIGVRPAGMISPLKVRLRLMVGLALGKEVVEIFPA
jgi:L-asparaginase